MHNYLQNVETVLKEQHLAYLRQIERLYGIRLKLFRQIEDSFNTVYGAQSGSVGDNHETINGVITGDSFAPATNILSGQFDEGWLYTSSDQVEVGDTVQLDSDDNKQRRFKVASKEGIGTTKEVFFRYQIASIAD